MYKRAISLLMCFLLLCGSALATGEGFTDYGNILRLADLLSDDGTTYTVTFLWEGAEFTDREGNHLTSPHEVSVSLGGTLEGVMPVLAGAGRVIWKNPNGEEFTQASAIYSNTSLTAEIRLGHCVTLIIGENTYEIYTQNEISQDQLIAADGTDFTRYDWTTEDGTAVTLLGYAPEGDVVLHGNARQEETVDRTLRCMVCLNGDWVQVGTIDRVYGPAQSGRYYLTTGQLASVYGRYGFDADAYNANNSQCFGHAEAGKNVWTDAPIAWENGEKLTQIFYSHNSTEAFEVYYMPGQLHNNVAPETAKANNCIWTVSASIPAELEMQLGSSRVLAYVPGVKEGDPTYVTTVELPAAENITWTWSGGGNATSVQMEKSEDGSKYVCSLTGVGGGRIVFTPKVTSRSIEFITDKGTYTYALGAIDLGQWVADNAGVVIGQGAQSMEGETEQRTFGQLDWQHLNGSQQGTYLSSNWVIGGGEPVTLRLQGMPRERTLVFRANEGSAIVTVDLEAEPDKLSQWLEQNKGRDIMLNNGIVIELGRFIWADAITGVPISAQQDISLDEVLHGTSIVLNGTHRTYYQVTLLVEHENDTQPCSVTQEVELNKNLIDWLNENPSFTIDQGAHQGLLVSRDNYRYTLKNPTDPIPQGYTVREDIVLYAHPRSYVGVVLKLGEETLATYPAEKNDGYERGMPLLQWVEAHASDSLGGGKTVHDYIWSYEGSEITNFNISYSGAEQEIVLTAQEKTEFVVDFDAGAGSWIPGSEPQSVVRLAGDCIPDETLSQISAMLVPPTGAQFIKWVYLAENGEEIPFDETMRVTSNMTVYARYAVCHEVTFYTNATLQIPINTADFENPVIVPDGEEIPANAYPYERNPQWVPEGQAFRYWVKVVRNDAGETEHLVFSINEPITQDMDLYPVLTRLVYIFRDAEGLQLTSVYWGERIEYVPQSIPEGKYYIGLRVGDAVIPNGTVAGIPELTSLGVIVPASSNGARVFENVEPVFGDQRTVIYHADADSEFAAGHAQGSPDEQRQTVNAEFTTLGMADIYRVVNASSQVLAGWALTPDGEVAYEPNEDVLSDDVLWDENGELHLYCIWRADEDAIVVTYETNYPADALDKDGLLLENDTYQVYIPSGSRPVLPTVEQTGFEFPSNVAVIDGQPQPQYSVAGWSIYSTGHDSGEVGGVYNVGTQYAQPVTQDTTFHLRWLDAKALAQDTRAYFFIRDDGNLPQEPGSSEASNYYPQKTDGSTSFSLYVDGALKVLTNVVNDTQAVSANLAKEPSKQAILASCNHPNSATYALIKDLPLDKWYVEWYAIKKDESGNWHVDGRVRLVDTFRLDYFPNGGSNVPMSTTHAPYDTATVEFYNGGRLAHRDGFYFLGWSENSWATEPDKGLEVDAVGASLLMTSDKKLYAVWSPEPIAMPAIYGEKYLRTVQISEGGETQQSERLLVNAEGKYKVTMRLEEAPDGVSAGWSTQVALDAYGRFTMPPFSFTRAGTFAFTITEDIPADADPSIAYDTATYRLVVYVRQTDGGLQIVSADMARNDIKIDGFSLTNAAPAFRFTNVEGLRDVTVRKVWDDGDNAHNLRPEQLTITLLGNDEVVAQATLSASNDWTHTFNNLPTKGEGGTRVIEYTVREEAFEHQKEYLPPVYGGEVNTGLVITNTYLIPTMKITFVKEWQGDTAQDRPEQLGFWLIQIGPGGEEVKRTLEYLEPDADGNWRTTLEVPRTINSGASMMDVDYRVEEIVPPGYALAQMKNEPQTGADGAITERMFTAVNVATTQVRISKIVSGTMGERTRSFGFVARLLDHNGDPVPIPAPSGAQAGYAVNEQGAAEFTLSHEQTVTLEGIKVLPGYRLEIQETDFDDYEVRYRLNEGEAQPVSGGTFSVAVSNAMSVEVTNHKDVQIDTGIEEDSEPLLWMLGIGAFLLAAVGGRRRWRRKV